MILGVDHIVLSGVDLEADGAALTAIGLKSRFVHQRLINLPAKAPLLHEVNPLHDIAVFDPDVGVAIELTVHGLNIQRGSHFGFLPVAHLPSRPVQPGVSHARLDAMAPAICVAFGAEAAWRRIGQSNAPICVLGSAKNEIVGAIHLVASLDASVRFFCDGLRAKLLESGRDGNIPWRLVRFTGPVPKWTMTLLLVEDESAHPLHLDSAGWPALAVLSSSIDEDVSAAAAAGATLYFRDTVIVNGRQANVGMVRGPSGEIVELLQFLRRK